MFDKFNMCAVKTLMLAQQEARGLGHGTIESEHFLLGMMSSGGLASIALQKAGLELDKVRGAVYKMVVRGTGSVEQPIPFGPTGKRVCEFGGEASIQLKRDYISTKHLLLGLLDAALEGDEQERGIAGKVLQSCGADLVSLRSKTAAINDFLSVDDGPPGPWET
jgi:ATP-dependent Clp protease ATP-binding subunit ClpC